MICGDESVIAGCIDHLEAGSCGGCPRRSQCAFVLPEALSFLLSRFSARPLERPARARHPFRTFLGEVAKGIERNRAPRTTPFRSKVERHLQPLLGAGPIRVEDVARALGYSRQTLYRRLKSEGATFEDVLDGLRHRTALRLIRDEALSVKEAAWRLGYSDPPPSRGPSSADGHQSAGYLRGRKPH